MKKVLFTLALAATLLASCGKDNENDNIAQKMIGKWMTSEINGRTATTNEKVVYTFESDPQGYLSASGVDFTEDHPKWTNYMLSAITVDGNTIIMNGSFNKTTSFTAILDVKSINETEMLTDSRYTVYHNGEILYENDGTVKWTKVPKNYRDDILGLWEGHITSADSSRFDDGELHRWEYRNDGTYIYYRLNDNGQWVYDVNEMALYFVDGTLLCTRWRNTGDNEVEHREWWEIASIENGVMNWTALRQRDDGSTYTTTFSMTKVQ